MSTKSSVNIILIALSPIVYLAGILSSLSPALIEKYYSQGIYSHVVTLLSGLASHTDFSIAQIILAIFIIYIFYRLVDIIFSLFRKSFVNSFLKLLSFLSIIYVLFMLVWGFNYRRLPLETTLGLTPHHYSERQLYAMCSDLVKKANSLRTLQHENKYGIASIQGGFKSIAERAPKGYKNASEKYIFLSKQSFAPKAFVFSKAMCYLGLTGFYFPYTGEANLNIYQEEFMLPATAEHELAHQQGFAREEEANFLSYLVCINHPDPDFKYSGTLLALVHSGNALFAMDKSDWKKAMSLCSPGLKRDLNYQYNLWKSYSGPIEKLSSSINNGYLKSNGEKSGVQSYGHMTDLLLEAYYQGIIQP